MANFTWKKVAVVVEQVVNHASSAATVWKFGIGRKNLSSKLKDKLAEMDEVIQFLLDQDAKKGIEIDKLKERSFRTWRKESAHYVVREITVRFASGVLGIVRV